MFEGASGRSLPRGERPIPHTKIEGSTAFSASYVSASAWPHTAAETFGDPGDDPLNCGLTKSGWLHSFITTNCFTCGNACASFAAHAANCAAAFGSRPSACECNGYTSSSTLTPASLAAAIEFWRKLSSVIVVGFVSSQRTVITFCVRPTLVSAPKNGPFPSSYLPASSLAPQTTSPALACAAPTISAATSAAHATVNFFTSLLFLRRPKSAAVRVEHGRPDSGIGGAERFPYPRKGTASTSLAAPK